MRWERQRVDGAEGSGPGDAGMLPLELPQQSTMDRNSGRAGLRLPEPVPIEAGDAGAHAIEVRARSLINRVPGGARVPFHWTINPYRGCGHACRYCFARRTHEYLELDSGHDFDSKIVVKVNAGELVRRELASPQWSGESIAMGTNTDPYQRAEGVYRLMPKILAALRDRANPFSILTKGTLILRDRELIEECARRAPVSIAVSIGSLDEQLWRGVEPGTPAPARRLEVVRRFAAAGIPVSVMMAPILPGLSDSPEQIDRTVAGLAEAGASRVTPLLLHLRPGAREWYHRWLGAEHPGLLPLYERLYRRGASVPADYQRTVLERVHEAKRRYGVLDSPEFAAPQHNASSSSAEQGQLSLL